MHELKALHIVPRWSHGGPAPGVVAEAGIARQTASAVRHQAIALESAVSSSVYRRALAVGLRVHLAPDLEAEQCLIAAADVVVLHFWSTPAVLDLIDRWRGRPLRWILYLHVNGLHRPQRLPSALADNACHVVLTCPSTRPLVAHQRVDVIPALTRFPETALPAKKWDRRRIIHVGTLNVFKISPDMIPLHAGAVDANNPVIVAGAGGGESLFREDAECMGVADRFRWIGFQQNLPSFFQDGGVFSYPVSRYSYASSDRVIQEAQAAGVPVLVHRHSPLAYLVRDGETGLLADGNDDYREKLRAIAHGDLPLPEPASVRQAALDDHHPLRKCQSLDAIYRRVAELEPRPVNDDLSTAEAWLDFQIGSVEEAVGARHPSVAAMRDDRVLSAHQRWACEGGLAHFANAKPDIMQRLDILARGAL